MPAFICFERKRTSAHFVNFCQHLPSHLFISLIGVDRFTQHRYKADQAFLLNKDKAPVAAYLDIDYIVKICAKNEVEAVHPGYGLLSENADFAQALNDNGIVFIGPTVDNLRNFGDKTTAKEMAIAQGVPVIAGSDDAFASVEDARAWIEDPANNCEYPVIVKAAMGGGGRGIRIVPTPADLEPQFKQAANEALNVSAAYYIYIYIYTLIWTFPFFLLAR